ncbi:hypothetical protein [Hymenobacter rubripertinctus]|uniref:Uncharacterized protein n=1 Tax=Hymenobacter rubripertinctus TaxID=2029981 RepID=A0A418QTD6_9BACT|nr:hypothetical protein [Hymenobacter rubripertinctus]RIY08412.1 hypothetical protein D0T11_14320 [Hymenobacter rubripertinctus]
MISSLRIAGLGLLLTAAVSCQQKPADQSAAPGPSAAPVAANAAPAVATDTPDSAPLPAPPDSALTQKVQEPRLNDVYVVTYQPAGGNEQRYFFYRVSAIKPKSVDLLPARQESTDPRADVSAAGFFTDKPLTYTRAEALELMQEQPGDVQHTRLIGIRRE